MKLNEHQIGLSAAAVVAALTILFSLLGPFGWHMGGQYMAGMHGGTGRWAWGAILVVIVLSLIGYLAGFVFSSAYNKLEGSKK